jgi:outer membrane usher protein
MATAASGQTGPPQPMPLQLEVLINGQPSQMIAAFLQLPDSRIAIKRSELVQIGIKAGTGPPDEVLPLSGIAGLKYNYNLPHQTIDLRVPDGLRIAKLLDAAPNSGFHEPQRTTGAYLNYTAFLAGDFNLKHPGSKIDDASISFDGNVYGSFGTVSQSAILGLTTGDVLRLNTGWSYSDPASITSYRAGDLITGGLGWTRPLRLGGVQVARNFGIRPDLVTLPLPSLSGSAAVPSTLDVYLGNVKTYSTEIPSGPYQINNLPVVSGAGTARLVVTDVTGRQIESTSTVFTDARLLRQGLVDYSAEAGSLRLKYGLRSSIYDDAAVATASGRVGLTDHVTLQAHAELGHGLFDLGAGTTFSATPFGLVSGAASVSQYGGENGLLLYGAWDFPAGDFNLHASTQRAIWQYRDLASLPVAGGSAFPRAIDQVALSYHLPSTKSSLSLDAIHADQGPGSRSMILSLSFDAVSENGMVFSASGFRDMENNHSFGAFAGLSMPLQDLATGSIGVTSDHLGSDVIAGIVQPLGTEPGSFGGSVDFSTGGNRNQYVNAYGAARLRGAILDGMINQIGGMVNANASFSGALVFDRGSVLFAQRIDDAFAVVDAGAPGVQVMRENQPVGFTDSSGKLVVAGLNSYQENKLSIDAANLPISADVPSTEMHVVPAERSGVAARFGIRKSLPSAVVIFTRPDGSFIDPGSHGMIQETGETFVVGYDGRAFIRKLGAKNNATVNVKDEKCQATFAFAEDTKTLVTIGPAPCR